jgi:hypothetical protein
MSVRSLPVPCQAHVRGRNSRGLSAWSQAEAGSLARRGGLRAGRGVGDVCSRGVRARNCGPCCEAGACSSRRELGNRLGPERDPASPTPLPPGAMVSAPDVAGGRGRFEVRGGTRFCSSQSIPVSCRLSSSGTSRTMWMLVRTSSAKQRRWTPVLDPCKVDRRFATRLQVPLHPPLPHEQGEQAHVERQDYEDATRGSLRSRRRPSRCVLSRRRVPWKSAFARAARLNDVPGKVRSARHRWRPT